MARRLLFEILDAPSEWRWLDPLAARVKHAVDVAIRPRAVRDVLHGKAIGHPAHPPLAQAALSGWSGAAVLGAAELMGGPAPESAARQRVLLGLTGLASAAPAVVAGLGDWSELHEDQQRTGLVHSAWLDVGAGIVATAGAAVGGHLAYRWSAGPNHAEAFPHLAKEGWTRVCLAEDLADGELRAATAGDEPIVVGRQGDRIFALADRCSHLAGPLHEGEVTVVGEAQCLVCPWHGSAFRIEDGEVMAGPAYAPQPVLEVRTVSGWVDVQPVQLPGVGGR
jgi:nitrite reductase/ring-hydroxylating ferredoxin subunit